MDKKSTPSQETNQDLTTKVLDSDKEHVQEDSAGKVSLSAEASSLKEERFDEDNATEKTLESVEEVSSVVATEKSEDMPSDMTPETVEEESSEASSEKIIEENSSPKGSAAKKVLGVLVVAALAGGTYYAQQHQFFGLLGNTANEQSESTEAGALGEQVPTAGSEGSTPEVNATVDVATVESATSEPSSSESSSGESSSGEPSASGVAPMIEQSASTEETTSGEQATVAGNESSTPEQEATSVNASTTEPSVSVEVTSEPSTSAITASTTSETAIDAPVAKMPEQAEVHDSAQTEVELQRKIASIRLAAILKLYLAADFERTVRVSKENTLKILELLKKHVELQSEALWSPLRQAIERDEQVLQNSEDIDLHQLFKATHELAQLVEKAPFMSAETGEVILHPDSEKDVITESVKPGDWLGLAINQVERLPAEAYEAIRSDLGGLIRVEKLSNPEVATLPVERLQQLRQETLLQISIAQEALLKRQSAIWQEAMSKVEQLLSTYYNTSLESTQQALALTRQLIRTSIQSELPALENTQQAVEQLMRQLQINK